MKFYGVEFYDELGNLVYYTDWTHLNKDLAFLDAYAVGNCYSVYDPVANDVTVFWRDLINNREFKVNILYIGDK